MKIYFLFVIIVLLVACSHTNNLKKYDLTGRTILFEEVIASTAGEAVIDLGTAKESGQSGVVEAVKDAALSVGNTLLTYEMERRLRNALRPDSIAKGISKGFETSMIKILRIDPVYKLNDRSEYVVTTILKKYRLFSNNSGVYITVSASVEILSRSDGVIVWAYDDSETVRIRRDNYIEHIAEKPFLSEVSQMVGLATLSENQIRNAIYDAAFQIGRNLSETLRKDIAELKGK